MSASPPRIHTLFLVLALASASSANDDHPRRIRRGMRLFRSDVRSLLIKHCLPCHGKRASGGLNLLTRQGLLRGGRRGPVVVPGNPHASRLLKLVQHDLAPRMPKDGDALPARAIRMLADWISNEAPYTEPLPGGQEQAAQTVVGPRARSFWSFRPLQHVTTARVGDRGWSRQPLDTFIHRKWSAPRRTPDARASRSRLQRRGSLALTGLPPTPRELDAMAAAVAPDAWERQVDAWLASPAFGERWARHWLDVARFAESYGFEHDLDNDHAFHYRDFVIQAFNSALPYDDFVRWQIAGDEIAPQNALARMATGFLAAGVHNADIAKVGVEMERYNELDDMASTVGTAMLGLSIGCSRCHDHKFDPLSQEDYYRFVATFDRTVRGEMEFEVPTMVAGKRKVLVAGEGVTPLARIYAPPPAFYEQTWFLRRGDPKQKDHVVTFGFPAVLTPRDGAPTRWQAARNDRKPYKTTHRRAALARWITDVDNGAGSLLARVIVNRLWHYHFGRGLVSTPNDFGERGERPSHPALLEWLAADLVGHDWDLKRTHRLIVTSAAWRQAVPRQRLDSRTSLFHGQQRRRMDAETLRDSMLAISGRLDRQMHGPGSLDPEQPRRSIYFRVKRSRMIPMMKVFDAPDALQSLGKRSVTTVAPQALLMMNASVTRTLARDFSERLLSEHPQDVTLVRHAYRLALGRLPSSTELAQATEFIRVQQTEYKQQSPPRRPPDEASLLVWLDAASIADSVGNHVERWENSGKPRILFSPRSDQLPTLRPRATPLRTAAVSFGPAANVMIAHDSKLRFGTGDFTLSILFRLASDRGDDHIIGKDSFSGGNTYGGYFLQHVRGHLRFSTRRLVNGKGPVSYLDSQTSIRQGQWVRATGVRRSGVLSLYLNDATSSDVSRREPGPTDVNTGVPLKLGEMDESASGALHGQIAEVLIYRRGLSSTEVVRLHDYLRQKHLGAVPDSPRRLAVIDFCQALFCLNEFIFVE